MMDNPSGRIASLVGKSLDRPLSSDIKAMADHVLSLHPAAAAIMAYGSCLRDVSTEDSLVDLYVLTARDDDVSASWLGRKAAHLLPPNVYYAETAHDGRILRCKYAILTLASFARHMLPDKANPYFWARFSQPAALVHAASPRERDRVVAAIVDAVTTMYRAALASAPAGSNPLDVWTTGFGETYRTELRPESGGRARELVAANAEFYSAVARILGAPAVPRVSWPQRRLFGKILSVARLIKAGFTFEGGASYAAWKIERHSGKKITLSPWQKRHPVLAGLMLLPQLLWRGAVK
jgi:hypothetical protein